MDGKLRNRSETHNLENQDKKQAICFPQSAALPQQLSVILLCTFHPLPIFILMIIAYQDSRMD